MLWRAGRCCKLFASRDEAPYRSGMPSPSAVEAILAELRANARRVTSSRRAILEAFVRDGGHVTAERLTTEVQRRHPDVHESTVYRFLDDLEELGIVDHVHLGHGPAVYHLAEDRHHHLVCQGCGTVVEFPPAIANPLRRKLHQTYGFDVDLRHFAIPGRCRECAAGAG